MQLLFYTGDQFPAEYKGDAFVTLHGSWNREPPSGYEVVRVHFKDGKPETIKPFLTGFLSETGPKKWARFARPFGLVQMPDGSLLLGEDQNGVIYRICYKTRERRLGATRVGQALRWKRKNGEMTTPPDQVVLKDLTLFAKHGLFDAEAQLGQRFYIDVSIGADLSYAERDDAAEGTVNWADLVEVVTKAFTLQRFKLVEAAAMAIVEAIFNHFSRALTVRVEVRKPSAPIEAIFAYTAVIIERQRG